MNKKLLSLLLFVMAAFTTAFAEETTVYDGDATNVYVPIYGYWADSFNKCEFVMDASELQMAPGSTITALKWYLSTIPNTAWGGNFKVFIKEVEANTLSAFVGTEGATVVWEGAVDATDASGVLALEFSQAYTYEGGNLLIGVYQTETGTFKSGAFYGTEVSGASVSGYNSSSIDNCSATQRNFVPKTTFTYTPGEGAVYYKPTNLQVSDIGPNSAKVTWEAGSTETSWNVEYKKAADEEWTSAGAVSVKEITLDALANGTAYNVRVQADYGNGNLSLWLSGNFTTSVCDAADMGEISYELTDTYGDGWNGNKLQIVYNGTVIQELTLTTGGKDAPVTGTVALCYGADYDLVWVAGNYAYETGFTITDPSGDVIYEYHGTGSSSGPVPTPGVLTTFQINQVTCPRPTNLAASDIVYNGAKLTWTPGDEEQDAWEVIYAEGTPAADAIDMVPVNVTGEASITLDGLTENTTYTAYVRGNCGENDKSNWSDAVTFTTPEQFPMPTALTISDITINSAKGNWEGTVESYNFRYRVKGGVEKILEQSFEGDVTGWSVSGDTWGLMPISSYTMSGTPLFAADGDYCLASCSLDDEYSPLDIDNWALTPEVDLKGTLEFYVGDLGEGLTENYSVYVIIGEEQTALAEGLTTPGVMPSSVEAWEKKTFDLSTFEGQRGKIAFRHQHSSDNANGYYFFLDAVSINGDEIAAGEWITMEGVTSPVDIEGLTPSTTYEAQVQAIYGENLSGWTESVDFTTLDADAMPTLVEVPEAEVTDKTATVYVEGAHDTYNIRYRKVGEINQINENFETMTTGSNPPEGWTMIDADGDGNCWYGWAPADVNDKQGNPVVNGAGGITSASYQSTALTPDNWLITPKVNLGGTLSFMYRGQDPSYAAEHFAVYVSVGDPTDPESFVQVGEETVAGATLAQFTADLSEYEGKAGYIAIRHFNCTDEFRLNIDDFVYNHNDLENILYEWTTVENVEVPYTIEGLEAETEYEVKVQGVYGDITTDWTAPVQFTTLEEQQETGMDEFYLVGTFNDWSQEEDGGRIVFEEVDGVFTATVTLDAEAEFKIITPTEDGGWKWFGGQDDNHVGYFLINANLLNVNITLVEGSNFRVEEAGSYTLQLMEQPSADGLKGINEPLVMKVVKNEDTGIANINVDKNSNDWYNLNGQKLNGKPTVPGIYINGNKKVVIK